MELALLLPAQEARGLSRSPTVRHVRAGAARGQAIRIVWHDGPAHALAEKGRVLAETSGIWRLEQNQPAPAEPWTPGADHRLIDEARAPDLPHSFPPEGLSEVGRFEGRRTVFSLAVNGAAVSMTVLQGMIRAGTAEAPAARLTLNGPAAAVRALALTLAGTMRLSVPAQGLAVEARWLADGTPPPPRRSGAPLVSDALPSAQAAFAHVVGHLTDVLLFLAPRVTDAVAGVEAVHQIRVAVRRARSAMALFRPVLDTPDLASAAGGLKRMSQILGPARDWDVFMTETLPAVRAAVPDQASLTGLEQGGAQKREAARAVLTAYLDSPAYRVLCLELTCLAGAEPPGNAVPLTAFAASVLRARWKKLLRTGKSLEGLDDSALHALRLKAKRSRYATEFLAPLFAAKPAARFIRRLSALQENLGVFNDASVARTLVGELSDQPDFASGLMVGFTASRGAATRPRIAKAWTRLRRQHPFWE